MDEPLITLPETSKKSGGFSLNRNLLLALALSGGLGTATGAGSANIFAVDAERITALQKQLDVLERQQETQAAATQRFYSETWSKLQHSLGNIDARLTAIERSIK